MRLQYQKSPVLFPMALVFIALGSVGLFFYVPYVYLTYTVAEFSKFPEPVAKKLRRALYYSNHAVDPVEAIKYYRQALQVADEIGMDPFSDEMLGVKFQVAAFYEKIEQYRTAIQVLEIVRRDCLTWVDKFGDKHWNDGKRSRVLSKTVATSLKLGELYSNKYIQDKEAAEQQLVWAVETVLTEKRRREADGVKEGEGDWISNEEFGKGLVALAQNYEEKNLHYLATPLFLHALTLLPQNTCHSVILMNNIASSLAQQKPPPPRLPPQIPENAPTPKSKPSLLPAKPKRPETPFPSTPGPTREELLDQARLWAAKARALSQSISGEDRTEDCDAGCAVATHNLGEIAEMLGQKDEAKRWYAEARLLAKKVGFEEGLENAVAGLKRVSEAT